MYTAITSLTEHQRVQSAQLQALITAITASATQGQGGHGKGWDHPEKYRDLQVFDGNQKTFEEWSVKVRSILRAGQVRVGQLVEAVERECSEEVMIQADSPMRQLAPEFDDGDTDFVADVSAKLYNLLLGKTTGEANAVVRRTSGNGLLAWKRLVSTLNPRTLASGIKAISAAINPPRVTQATRADSALDDWEDKLAKVHSEYGQKLTSKMKVAVVYSMMPRDLQERITDACAVGWDHTSDGEADQMYEKIKGQLKNMAKARREMVRPTPMEVDKVTAEYDWGHWGGGGHQGAGWSWGAGESEIMQCQECEDDLDEATVNMIGKGGGKKGMKGGFQGQCYLCGEWGHSQMYCPYSKGKGKGKEQAQGKGYGKDKGFGKGGFGWKGQGKSGKGFGGEGKKE